MLPAELDWALELHQNLKDEEIASSINHFKLNPGYTSKVYFRI